VLPQMRAQGAKVFVVLIHEGGHTGEARTSRAARPQGPIVDIVKKLDPAIRLVITGHSHKGYLCKVDGRVVTQADAAGHLLSRIKMTVDPAAARRRHRGAQRGDETGRSRPTRRSRLPARRARAQYAPNWPGRWPLGAPLVARKESEAGESPLGDLIADAVLAATREQGVQIGFMNPGGIRKDLETGAGGVVSFGQAQAVLPFGNTLVVMDMTGAQLRSMLEQQWDRPGKAPVHAAGVAAACRMPGTAASGGPAPGAGQPEGGRRAGRGRKTYRVVANNFLADGGDNFPEWPRASTARTPRSRPRRPDRLHETEPGHGRALRWRRPSPASTRCAEQ
jgi:5'-nucleotidase